MRIPSFHWWRTVFFLIPAISVYTIVLGTLSVCSTLFDRRGNLAHWCARAWSWLILTTTGVRVRVSGLERVPTPGTYVFVSNHQSIYDIPVIFASLPFQLRITAKESLGSFPFLGWHLRRAGHLLVDRRRPDRGGILAAWRKLIADGLSLIVFPEGTRSVDGRVGTFRAGSFLMALEVGLPVVPVAVVGSRHVMKKGRLMTCPGEVTLVIHDPIPTIPAAGAQRAARGGGAPQASEPGGVEGTPPINAAREMASRIQRIVRATVEAVETGGAEAGRPLRAHA